MRYNDYEAAKSAYHKMKTIKAVSTCKPLKSKVMSEYQTDITRDNFNKSLERPIIISRRIILS
jgi:hypothetical protein